MPAVNYAVIADEYDQRYRLHTYPGIRAKLESLVRDLETPHVLEVGCGTGNWLALLASSGCRVAGLDPSPEMLSHASARLNADLRQGSAEALPWQPDSFDAVIFVNALHHAEAPDAAVREAFRVLKPGGRLLSIGLDPHLGRDRWYVYDFFPQTLAFDLTRFSSSAQRLAWLATAGFEKTSVGPVEHLESTHSLPDALSDGILTPTFTSQFSCLSLNDYSAGITRIARAADAPDFQLQVDLVLYGTCARKPG